VASKVGPLGEYLREQRRSARLSLRQLADEAGVSNPYLSQIERGLRRPSADVLQRLAGALQVSSEAMYVRAGLLDEQANVGAVERAVQADDSLLPGQRRALLEVYRAFRASNIKTTDPRVVDSEETGKDAETATDTTTKEDSHGDPGQGN
jgi:transcriptional regulator with XRE-family HTH domain